MRMCFHEAAWQDTCGSRIKQYPFIPFFSRPPAGRSAEHALKCRCLKIRSWMCADFLPVHPFEASGKRYYPHIRCDHTSANWYNWKGSHSGQFIFCISCYFCCCPESDTFLKNYNIVGILLPILNFFHSASSAM